MSVNIELLDRTLAQIEAHPEGWEQGTYRCESGMCFAGWAAVLAGGRWVEPENMHSSVLVAEEADPDEDRLHTSGSVHAHDRARRVLGLDDDTADWLFDGHNKLTDLRLIVAEIKSSVPGETASSPGTDPSTTGEVPPTSPVVGSTRPVSPDPSADGSGQ